MASHETGGAKVQAANVPCRFYAIGACRRGDACWFKHDPSAVLPSATTSKSPRSPSSQLQASASVFTPSLSSATLASMSDTTMVSPTPSTSKLPTTTEDDEERVCVICYDAPKSFGLLESCAHVYCLTCIRDWRTEKGKTMAQIEGDVLQRCPACRSFSKFVIPSEWWIPEGPGKKSYIASYKERMGKIPCRNFVNSPPGKKFCPFGKDCFYQHLEADGSPHIFEHGMADHILASRRQREQRHLERHLRDFYTRWRNGELDGLDYGDDMDEDDEEDDDDFTDEWDDIDDEENAMEEDEDDDEEGEEEDESDDGSEAEFQKAVREAMRQSLLEQQGVPNTSTIPSAALGEGHIATRANASDDSATPAAIPPAGEPGPLQQAPEEELEGLRQRATQIAARASREQARAEADRRAIDRHSDIAIEAPGRLPNALVEAMARDRARNDREEGMQRRDQDLDVRRVPRLPTGLAAALGSSFSGRGRYVPDATVAGVSVQNNLAMPEAESTAEP